MGLRIVPGVAMTVVATLGIMPAAHADTTVTATVIRWSDGDTVVTTEGKVRLIGVNAPDAGEPAATGRRRRCWPSKLAPVGSTRVTLTADRTRSRRDRPVRAPAAVRRRVGGADIGRRQIKAGSVRRRSDYRRTGTTRTRSRRSTGSRDSQDSPGLLRERRPERRTPPVSARTRAPSRRGSRATAATSGSTTCRRTSTTRQTNPEECFASEDGAKKAGYRAALV